MSSDSVPTLSADLIWRELDDGTVIVTPEEGTVRVLNNTGTAIWLLIDGSRTSSEIAFKIAQKFEVSQEQAIDDVSEFLSDLSRNGLIELAKEAA